jgi:hypothetical protein
MAQSQFSDMLYFEYDDKTMAACVDFVRDSDSRKVITPASKGLMYATTVRTLSRSLCNHFIP